MPTLIVEYMLGGPEEGKQYECAVGGRSALAVATLRDMGYINVAQLDGGFAAWRTAGKPVEPVKEASHEIVEFTGVTP